MANAKVTGDGALLKLLRGAGGMRPRALARAPRLSLEGKVAVVTGGGRGLGFAIASELARRGCKLAICGRDRDEIEQAAAALRAQGAEVLAEACDVSRAKPTERFIADVIKRFGSIDVLVNNAAQCFVGPAASLDAEALDRAIKEIFWVVAHPTMTVLPHMRARGEGRIVNVSSVGGLAGLPHMAAYSTGKFAVAGYSETLAAELSKEGVYVSHVAPPPLRNGAQLATHFAGDQERELAWFSAGLTSRLLSVDAEKAARAVADAAERGDPQRCVSVFSWLLSRARGIAPGLTVRVLALVDSILPAAPEPDEESRLRTGSEVFALSHDPLVASLGEASAADAARFRPATR